MTLPDYFIGNKADCTQNAHTRSTGTANVQFEFPVCVILTHRHGACLGIFVHESAMSKACSADLTVLLQTQENFEFFMEKNSFICARVLGKTAENLAHLFQFAIRQLNSSHIKNFVVGTGPGSFTGLRLGCAFVNGMHLSSDVGLYSVQTTPLSNVSEFVTFSDLFSALQKIAEGDIVKCTSLLPDYNKILS